jgi:hypothetical protein
VVRGVRAVAGVLSIDVDLNTIDRINLPRLHSGGTVGQDGLRSDRQGVPRSQEQIAILQKGEGVIPADIWQSLNPGMKRGLLTGKIQMENQHTAGEGGFFDSALDIGRGIVRGIGDGIEYVRENVLRAAFAPFKAIAKAAINQIPINWMKDIANSILEDIEDWVTGANDQYNKQIIPLSIKNPPPRGEWGVDQGLWRVMEDYVQSKIPSAYSSSSFRATMTATGNRSMHGYGRAVDLVNPGAGGLWAVFNLLKNQMQSHELIFTPAGYQQIYRGQRHIYGEPTASDHYDHVHWSLANGGIVKGGSGGVLARIGEGSHDELVTPLPSGWNDDLGTTYNFYGDLEFPNVTNGDDAKGFISNLKALTN